jgi:uncharacterized phage protein (TIGR01671 family)
MTPLYKAKRKDNGEWVQGYYWKYDDFISGDEVHCIRTRDAKHPDEIPGIVWHDIKIDPDTLCASLGLPDRNRKTIFEHDLISWGDRECRAKGNQHIVEVVWSGGGFCIKDGDILREFWHYNSHEWADMPYAEEGTMDITQYFRDTFEVIGNIHDKEQVNETNI